MTHYPDAGEVMNDFWSMSGNFIFRHHVDQRVKLYSPREESFPVPLKYIDVSRTTRYEFGCQARDAASMIIRISMNQEICVILGQVSLSLFYWHENTSRRIYVVREETDNTASEHPGQIIYGQNSWTKLGRNAQLKERQKVVT